MPDSVDKLRHAVERHDEWPTRETREDVIDAARTAIHEHDARIAYQQILLDQQLLDQQLGQPSGRGAIWKLLNDG